MRRHGLPNPYEQLKALTRGHGITEASMREFIAGLDLPDADEGAPAGDDARQLHRPGRALGQGYLTVAGDADGTAGAGFAQGVVEVVGPDLDRSIAFYRTLGFEVARRTGPFAVMHRQGQRLFLAESPDAPVGPRWCNLRIMVDDVDALCARLQALGIHPVHAPCDRDYGLRDFVVADPNGFELRFAQALSP